MWTMKRVTVVSAVVGTLGALATKFGKYAGDIGIDKRVGHSGKKALLGGTSILRLVF